MIGQVDCLGVRENINHWKFSKLDLSPILYKEPSSPYTPLYCVEEQDHGLADVLDWKLLEAAKPAIQISR
jgi:glutamate synthase (NADPH/NADH) large chain